MGTVTLSTAAENDAVDGAFGTVTHVSLHTADPGTTGANEAAGNGYARQASALDSAASGATQNSSEVLWTASGGTLGGATLTHYGLWDSVSGGNFRGGGELTASRTVGDGDELKFAVGELDIEI